MKKRAVSLLFACLLLLVMLPLPARASAPLEVDRHCSMTLHYRQDNAGFPELEIKIYRIAQAHADGTFSRLAPFSGYPVNIYGITSQREWKTVATTLTAFITADQVPPTATVTTDDQGVALFSGLPTGLYLIAGVTAENDNGVYIFEDFMMYLPTPGNNGTFCYDMEAVPKCSSYTPKTEFTVTKLWKDSGNSAARPASVTVEIYKDGELYDTVILSTANNWTSTWKDTDSAAKWSVVETDVPQGYTVSVTVQQNSFHITNSRPPIPSNPKTGDSFPLIPWVMGMCISGFLLIILAIWLKRKDK